MRRRLTRPSPSRFPESGQQEIAALFEPRDAVLGDPEGLGDADLCQLAGLPKLTQCHFLGNELGCSGLDLPGF